MKILLINPWEGEVFPTPAIGYLQAVIREKTDAFVDACDLANCYEKLTDQWDIIAVTFHSFSVKFARKIRELTHGRLICGGHHPSAMPKQMLSLGYDQVVVGEGENAILDIIAGDKKPIIYDYKQFYKTIDDFPFPVYDGLSWNGSMGLPVISSRGCPFGCNFCASSLFWQHKWHGRSPDNIIKEIAYHKQRNNIKTFMFEDDNFTLDRQRAINICDLIIRSGLHMMWQCASRAESLDMELCQWLYRSGCRTVWLGVESLSEESLTRTRKNTTVDKMLTGIANAERAGIQTMSQFIVGLPGDTIKDIQITVHNIKRSAIRRRGTNIAWILPGTEIYDKAKQHGYTDDRFLDYGAEFYTYEQDINILNHWSHLINTA